MPAKWVCIPEVFSRDILPLLIMLLRQWRRLFMLLPPFESTLDQMLVSGLRYDLHLLLKSRKWNVADQRAS